MSNRLESIGHLAQVAELVSLPRPWTKPFSAMVPTQGGWPFLSFGECIKVVFSSVEYAASRTPKGPTSHCTPLVVGRVRCSNLSFSLKEISWPNDWTPKNVTAAVDPGYSQTLSPVFWSVYLTKGFNVLAILVQLLLLTWCRHCSGPLSRSAEFPDSAGPFGLYSDKWES